MAKRADGRIVNVMGVPDGALENSAKRWRYGCAFGARGSRQTTWIVSGAPLHFYDGREWQEYDTRVVAIDDPDFAYGVAAADRVVKFNASANSARLVRLEQGDAYLELVGDKLCHDRDDSGRDDDGVFSDKSAGIETGDDTALTRQGWLRWDDALGEGMHLEIQPLEARLTKRVILDAMPGRFNTLNKSRYVRLRWKFRTNCEVRVDGESWDGSEIDTEKPVELWYDKECAWTWPMPIATDANGDTIVGTLRLEMNDDNYTVQAVLPLEWFRSAAYPVMVDPDTYYGGTEDGRIYGQHSTTYAAARATSTGNTFATASEHIGQSWSGSSYIVRRGYVLFDTSGITDSHTVTKATLTLTCASDNSTTDFDLCARKHNWLGDWGVNQETDYDGALAATTDVVVLNTSGIAVDTSYTSPNLDTSWISLTGYTRYALVSSRDIAGTTPTGYEFAAFYMADSATQAYRPYLSITTVTGQPQRMYNYRRRRA